MMMRRWNRFWIGAVALALAGALLPAAYMPLGARPGLAQEGVCDSAPTTRLAIGAWAQVTDVVAATPAGGLRLREAPRTEGVQIDVLAPRTLVRVINGPECNDGFRWWLVSVHETGEEGWAAEGITGSYYLSPTLAPTELPPLTATASPPPTLTPSFTPPPTDTPPPTEVPPTAVPTTAAPQATEATPLPTAAITAVTEVAVAPQIGGAMAQVSEGGGFAPLARVRVPQAQAVALSPDGSLAAVALPDGVQLYAADTMTPRDELQTDSGAPRALAFSPDGATLLVGYDSGELIGWDVATAAIARRETSHNVAVTRLAYGPGGVFASADATDQIILHSADGETVRSLAALPAGATPEVWQVTALAFRQDGALLLIGLGRVSGGDDGQVLLYDLADLAGPRYGTAGTFNAGAFIAGSELVLLYGVPAYPATMWEPASGIQQNLTGSHGWTLAAPQPFQTAVALAGHGGVLLWDYAAQRDIAALSASPARAVRFSQDGTTLLAHVADEIVIWRQSAPRATETMATAPSAECPEDPAPSYLRVGATAQVANPTRPVRVRAAPLVNSIVIEMAYSSDELPVVDGPLCADGYRWWSVAIRSGTGWTVEAASGRYLLIDPDNPPPAIVFLGGPTLEPPPTPPPAQTPIPTPRPQTPPEVVKRARYTPDGTLLAVGSGDGVRLYDAGSFELRATLAVGPVLDFVTTGSNALSAPLRLFAVTWGPEGVRVVDVPSGQTFRTLLGGPYDPAWAAASPDGAWLVLGPTSDGAAATLWDLAAGRLPDALPYWWAERSVEVAAFTPDGHYVLVNDILYNRDCQVNGRGCTFDLIRNDFVAAGVFGGVGWSGDGTTLIGFSDRFWLWDGNNTGIGLTLQTTLNPQDPRRAALNADASRGAIAARSLMEVWNLAEGNYYANRVIDLPGLVRSLDFRPDGTQIAAAAGESVVVYDPISGNVIRQVE